MNFLTKLNFLFSKKEKAEFLIVLLGALLTGVFQAIGVASILPFINVVTDSEAIKKNYILAHLFNFFNFSSVENFLIFLGVIVFLLMVVGNTLSIFSIWMETSFVWKKNHTLSRELFRRYLSMSYAFFLDQRTSELGKNVLDEVRQLTSKFLLPLVRMITSVIIVIIISFLLLYVNFLATILAAGFFGLIYSLLYFYLADKLRRGGKEYLQQNKERYEVSAEALGGIKDIKVFSAEEFFLNKFTRSSENFSKVLSWHQIISRIPRYIMEMFAFGGVVGIIILLIYRGASVEKSLPLISLFVFAGYRLIPALQEIFKAISTLKFNKAILDKIYSDMSRKEFCQEDISLKRLEGSSISFEKIIALNDLCFSYPKSKKMALDNINLEIRKKSFVAIIGPSGSGKTTLVDIILGLLKQDSGNFKIDGVKVNSDNIRNWRSILGYVPQQIYLSDDSIARNIAFGVPEEEINEEQVVRAAKIANLHKFINEELSEQYETFVGERGVRLSGGQKQRVGIARALYHDPEILLFDEATSALDDKTEDEVLKAIEKIAKKKTMIVIAHRLTTVRNCDKIYMIKNGKIEKMDSYKDLVNNKSNYYQ